MGSRQGKLPAIALVGLAVALSTLAGCGGSGSGGSTGGESTSTAGAAGEGSGGRNTTSAGGGKGTESDVAPRGQKGERPGLEDTTGLRISGADCARLAAAAEASLERRLEREAKPTPPLSKCRLEGRGATINAFLDNGFGANERYMNRMEETQQFGAPDPRKVPHPVPGVGEEGAYNQNAMWVPAYRSLFAVRGNRWITVAYSVAGEDDRESRDGAADLARLAFRLTAG